MPWLHRPPSCFPSPPLCQTIRFEGSQEEFQLVVEASCVPVAVFPAEACTDLRCCVFGKLYLKKVRADSHE